VAEASLKSGAISPTFNAIETSVVQREFNGAPSVKEDAPRAFILEDAQI
jgi:hypothetical protein